MNIALQKIENLDFAELKAKLMLPEPEGYNWSSEQVNAAELWYKRFLMLQILHPGRRHTPNVPVDMFWHAHILDTERYAADCQNIFSRFVHHFPYLGLRDDRPVLNQIFGETNALFRREFGTDATLELMFAGLAADCSDPCSTDEGD